MTTRYLICGSRTYDRHRTIALVLDTAHRLTPDMHVIVGGANGADTHAEQWAKQRGVHGDLYRAYWDTEGKAAGFNRNLRMLDHGKPDLVLAFVDKPLAESRGTAHTVSQAKARGLRCIVFGTELDGSHADDGLWQVTHNNICAGFEVEHGVATNVAPVLRQRLKWWRTKAVRVP